MAKTPDKRDSRRKRQLAVVIGSIALLISAALLVRPVLLLATASSAEGKVIEFVPDGDYHRFRVQFDVDGRTREIRTNQYRGSHASESEFFVGKKVTVLYPPDAPEEGRVLSLAELFGAAITAAIPGVGLLLYGLNPKGLQPVKKKPAKKDRR